MKVINILNKKENRNIPKRIINWDRIAIEDLNEEVVIIEDTPKEDKKIEKLNKHVFLNNHTLEEVDSDLDFMLDKINEIIDRLNGEEND
ncbi:MAG: hypothetical protein VZR33_02420 [Methanosphaera sp.]|nr:hypothetical protein [Methanosphaera sp.]